MDPGFRRDDGRKWRVESISRRVLLAAAIILVATTGVLAQAATPPGPPAASAAPQVRQQNCLLKTLNACKVDGSCAPLDNLKGEKLPVKMTVDLTAGIVAGVDREGWVDATRIVSLARAADELILQGIDGVVAWQMLIDEKNEIMSLSLATDESATIGFGECTAVKEP
jgi:hypothetical protein